MNLLRLSLVLTAALVVWSASNIMWGGEHHHGIVKADGKGYYAHLPALFIYNDWEFEFFDSVENRHYYNENYYYDYRAKLPDGSIVNKYFCGTAVPMLPGFLIAHAYALSSDKYPADGFAKPYNISVSISAIVFMLLTLVVWLRIFTQFKIDNKLIAFVIPTMVFGSNWYYYLVCEPAVSHVYTVFLASWFVERGLKWGRTGRVNMLLLASLLALITLIRPVNAMLIGFTPFFFTNGSHFVKSVGNVFKKPGKLAFAIVIAAAIIIIQLVLYKIQTGDFWVYSYQEEGFNFSDPQIFNILFSYKKGLFLYTPIMLIALLGLIPLTSNQTWRGVSLLVVFGGFTYVVSSWWNWYYGGSFSSRVYLDILVLFAIGLAYLLKTIQTKAMRSFLMTVLIALVLLCQFQTYQYRRMIIHWDGMTEQTYWEAFLNFDVFKR